MDLDTYDDWAKAELLWFRKRLFEEGIEALQRSCAELGEAAVRDILRSHQGSIDDLLHTPKSKRAAVIRRIPAGRERHAFLIAAVYTVRCGSALLSLATHYGLSADMRPSKSLMLLQASVVARDLQRGFPSLWPFEDSPDPFAGLRWNANDDEI